MTHLRNLWTRWRGQQMERDLDDELSAYVDDLTVRYEARGLSPDAARRAALVEVGGVQQVREQTREAWAGHALETVLRDVRHGMRQVRRAPGFAAVVIATLALVIGANATVFSVMHAVLWRPLPYPAAERLVVVDADARGVAFAGLSGGETQDLAAEPQLVDRVAHFSAVDANVTVDDEMERVWAASASDDMLDMLGAAPLAHGDLVRASQHIGGDGYVNGVVVSHALWLRRLGGDPAAIGRHIEVNNLDVQVIGVTRPDFRVFLPARSALPDVVDVWFPRPFRDNDRRSRGQMALARLAPGVTIDAAAARLTALGQRLVADYPADYGGVTFRLFAQPLQDALTAQARPALWVLGGAVAFVLLIGCANVANLMVARARQRAPEIAIRRALGASRGRVARQLLTEVALLTAIGAALGFALAFAGVALVDWLRPTHLPRQSQIVVNGTVALFTAGLAALVTVICGLLPARRQSDQTGHEPLRAGRMGAQRAGARRLQRGLVIAEVALSIVPLVAAGLMLRTFVNLTNAPIGFNPADLLSAKMGFSFRQFREPPDRLRLYRAARDRVAALPGVEEVTLAGPLPFDDPPFIRTYGRADDPADPTAPATVQSVFPGYLRIAGITLREGRDFTEDDLTQARPLAVIDERIARRLWPNGAIGQRLIFRRSTNTISYEVIGVMNPVRVSKVRDTELPHILVPYDTFGLRMALVARTKQPAAALAPLIKERVESLGTRRPVFDVTPLTTYVERSMAETRFMMLVLVGFAVASMLLAAVGIYGTLAYLASQRTQEFGIRMALGASASRVLGSVAAEGLVMAAAGTLIGFAGAAAVSRWLRDLLYDVAPFDPPTLIAVCAAVAAMALVAATHPAWRASKTNPMEALRAE